MPVRGRPSPASVDAVIRRNEKLILALLQNPTLDKAAAAANVSTATLWRRTQEPEFQEQLRQARRDAFSQCVARLQHAAPAAVGTLLRVMADQTAPAASRLRAASHVLEHTARAMELDDLASRLARLEELSDRDRK